MVLNFSGKITKFFLENSPLAIVTITAVIALGFFGYTAMPKQYNPEVTLPAFVVITEYPGATAQEVEKFVTRELEEKIAEIPGVDTISSRSIDGGKSLVTVTFVVGEDLEQSKIKIFTKIHENLDYLVGKNISQPIIKNISPESVSIGIMAITSDLFSQNILREKSLQMVKSLQTVEGIANINISGGQKKSLTVRVNPEELKNRNISFAQVQQAIETNNGRRTVGNIKTDEKLFQVQVDAGIQDADTAKNIIVAQGVYLGDIAEISHGYTEKKSEVLLVNPPFDESTVAYQDAIYISFAKKKGVNTDVVMNAALKKFEALQKNPEYQDVDFTVVRNTATIANTAITGLGTNLLQSIGIVAIILLLFLGARSALLVSITIPLTLLFVFFMGYVFGQTINRITLFALILSLGLLVDSATVVVENIYRHLQDKSDIGYHQKIVQAVNEVGVGLFLSTLTSIIVFLPMTQITGMMGPYMGPLAFFVPMALGVSLVVAYIITPFLASVIFKKGRDKSVSLQKTKISFFQKISEIYAKILRKILNSNALQKIIIWVVFGAMALSFLLIYFEGVHFQMLPKADKKSFWVTIDLPEGSNFPATQGVAEKISDAILTEIEGVENIQIYTGTSPIVDFNGLFRNFSTRTNPHQSSLNITLLEDRAEKSFVVAQQVREKIKSLRLRSVTNGGNIVWRIVEDPPGPPVQATFVAKIFAEDEQVRKNFREKFIPLVQKTAGITDIDTSVPEKFPRMVISVDTQKAKQKNISTKDIYDAISLATEPKILGEFSIKNSEEISVIEFSIPKEWRDSPQDILKISLKNTVGQMIPLSSVVKISEQQSISDLYRDDHKSGEYITAEMENRSIIYAVRDLIFAVYKNFEVEKFSLYEMDIKEKISGETVTLQWGGEFKMTLDNFRDLLLAMMGAFALVYMVLVAQFRSFVIPLLIMATVPLAFIGILPGFAFLDAMDDTYLTATALIGFIALMGIVVNNAIMYLEYLQVLHHKGMELMDALIQAGKTRLRPIMLTSLTTVLGSLTIAFDPVWSGLAWSIVFGLSLSTFLTLGIFPILYWRYKRV